MSCGETGKRRDRRYRLRVWESGADTGRTAGYFFPRFDLALGDPVGMEPAVPLVAAPRRGALTMSLSRWKLMAGVLGVSIGGLAAAASQCPKLDKSKGRQPEELLAFADTVKLPPAGAPSEPTAPSLPVPGPAVPPAPDLPKLPGTPPTDSGKAPAVVPSGPASIPDFPPPPSPEPKPAKGPDLVLPGSTPPALPSTPSAPDLKLPPAPATPTEPKPTKPDAPKVPPAAPALPMGELFPPAPEKLTPLPGSVPPAPPSTPLPGKPPVVGAGGTPMVPPTGVVIPTGGNDALQPPKADTPPLPIETPKVETPVAKPETAPAAATKYRIVLRVGEGEPTFEVKNGDDLVLKVACEKVDIKSPEKGASGLSAVTARGKVRFAGFGVEGTCTELSFMAGTGEVSMSGEVKVQMKDKLGRVESELTTTTLKYKIDASAVGASIKP
ncbi:hypothetical protein VT84_00165 [Gemmata sp. SH-PL17]|nr:hypothetical protein VT84_00165 [Gemmata sp. SH-PL17]